MERLSGWWDGETWWVVGWRDLVGGGMERLGGWWDGET